MTEDEKFFAWLDGELEGADASAMEAKVAQDPKLSKLAQQHRALGKQLKGAFDPIASVPVPDHLQIEPGRSAKIIDLAKARSVRSMPSLPQWAAMAATLAIGIFVGTVIPDRGSAPVEVQGGRIYAAGVLSEALDTELASAPSGGVRIGLTFRDRAGQICRSFTQAASSGLACRSGKGWQLKGLFAAPEGQSGDYRMAAGMDPNLSALVDQAMAGEPFDASAEKASRQKGWR